ncbi:nuclear transport factor 2 family protein [Chloroflexota bacterium]
MEQHLSPEKIRELAKALDDAIESRKAEEAISHFSDTCEIELLGVKLTGKEGLRKAVRWIFRYLKDITLSPITIMIEGNTFFEEFFVRTKTKGGKEIQVKQAEVLIYDDEYKVKSLRLYFDRLELAAAYTTNPIEKIMIDRLNKASLKGLL